MNINFKNESQINFGKRLNDTEYSQVYRKHNKLNGLVPDEFILSALSKQSQEGEKTVFDFGAGQGRNTIPVARNGHTVHALEINYDGLCWIRNLAFQENLKNKVVAIHQNILDPIKSEKKADFAYMAHISQHFDKEELQDVFNNVVNVLKTDGEFAFDALVRTKENYKKYDKLPRNIRINCGAFTPEEYGSASFWKEDIFAAAKKAGLKIIKEERFAEKAKHRAPYEKQNLWGGFRILEYLSGIGHRPVKLTWFVLKK